MYKYFTNKTERERESEKCKATYFYLIYEYKQIN